MRFQFKRLTIHCRKSTESIDFSPQVSFIHGPISAGKSSIARLLDFCLGGDLERTPAIALELVSVELLAQIEPYEVIFAREAKGSNRVRVTWRTYDGQAATLLAPLTADPTAGPIWEREIYSLSDLLFYFMGLPVLKVRRNVHDPDAPMIRLSFRDFLWYCYLEQDQLDSSFFRLEDAIRAPKSRNVMRFLVGFYTEKINNLENRLADVSRERTSKLEATRQIRQFLEASGVGTETQLVASLERSTAELVAAQEQLAEVRAGHVSATHFADQTRDRLRGLLQQLGAEEQALQDLNARISEQEALRAECLSTKFKAARTESASTILAGVNFELCPACGTTLTPRPLEKGECYLCHRVQPRPDAHPAKQLEMARRDLDARIEALEESIKRHAKAKLRQERIVSELRKGKELLDARLQQELRDYDSAFLARFREAERRVATLEERISGMERVRGMLRSVAALETEADLLAAEEQRLRRELEAERKGIKTAPDHIRAIEVTFLDALLSVGVPGVTPMDIVRLNQTSWVPWILPAGDEGLRYHFGNAGSGGKKTLINVCYALAVHRTCAERRLPLPSFLIIDTPMKNIGEDVNRDIFVSFYKYLYGLAGGPLRDTQFIVIDKEFIRPERPEVQLVEKYMTPAEDAHPPLISYYRGP